MTVDLLPVRTSDRLDSWTDVMLPVAQLANEIKGTDLVPRWLRGNVPAITGVILFGRELGLPPMTSLRTIYLIDGKPALYAEAMRALVLSRGHEITYGEVSAAQATVRGRRRDQDTWHEVTWTRDDARRAGLGNQNGSPWVKYPRAMLKARATAELCRDLFPDVVGGFVAWEESDDDALATPEQPTPRTRVRRAKATAADMPAPELPEPKGPPAEPPGDSVEASTGPPAAAAEAFAGGPDLDVPDAGTQQAVDALTAGLGPVTLVTKAEAATLPQNPAAKASDDMPWTDDQRRHIMASFADLGVRERGDRLALCGAVVGRKLTTGGELTRREASSVIDACVMAQQSPDPVAFMVSWRRQAGLVVDEAMWDDDGRPRDLLPEPDL